MRIVSFTTAKGAYYGLVSGEGIIEAGGRLPFADVSALLAAGKPHELLALVGVSHMTPQEVVAENLLLHQLDFLSRSLG